MAKSEEQNQTITKFLLLGFGDFGDLQFLLFVLLLMVYIITMVGNILIIVLIVSDYRLHTPMYFFLCNLSCLETCYSSNILPITLTNLLYEGPIAISVIGCMIQYYFFGFLAVSECYLLAAMSYDRYVAICNPLLYKTIMNGRVCLKLVVGSWISGSLAINITIYLMYQLKFCGPIEINHFFCDFNPILNLACNNTHVIEILTALLAAVCSLPPFLLTLASYFHIISTVVRIPSTNGRQKAFSTCSSHLIVVSIFYGSIMIVYILPKTDGLREINKVLSLFYTVLTPLLNPLIYSLRNREVKKAFGKTVAKLYTVKRMHHWNLVLLIF